MNKRYIYKIMLCAMVMSIFLVPTQTCSFFLIDSILAVFFDKPIEKLGDKLGDAGTKVAQETQKKVEETLKEVGKWTKSTIVTVFDDLDARVKNRIDAVESKIKNRVDDIESKVKIAAKNMEKRVIRIAVSSSLLAGSLLFCYFGLKMFVDSKLLFSRSLSCGLGFVALGMSGIIMSPYCGKKICKHL